MEAIHGVTMEKLAELGVKWSELTAKLGQQAARGEFEQFLGKNGLNWNVYSEAHNAWLARFKADPTGKLQAQFHMIEGQMSQKAHFGDVRDMSGDKQEGVTLDTYVQVSLKMGKPGADPAAICKEHGIPSVAQWQKINTAWTAAMGADTSGKLATQYGNLYQKHAGPAFQQQMLDQTAAILAEANKPQDVVDEPQEELTPELCFQKIKSSSRNERWKYARHLARMADLNNVPNKKQAIDAVTPILTEIIAQHDEHTCSDAEDAARWLWDLEVRNDDIKGDIQRCLNRAREKLSTLEAAFAPIRDKAVPERVTLQSQIQDHQSLISTMEDYATKEWEATASSNSDSSSSNGSSSASASSSSSSSTASTGSPADGSPMGFLQKILKMIGIG